MIKAAAVFMAFFVFASSVSAAGVPYCSTRAYQKTCKCPFQGEKVDEKCKDGHHNWAVGCLIEKYPVMNIKYGLGMCPAMEACVSNLKACDKIHCPGSNLNDCHSQECKNCFIVADRCAHMANEDCDDKEKCGNNVCAKEKGETQLTCCRDCGCPKEKVCKDNLCVEEEQEEEIDATEEDRIVEGITEDDVDSIAGEIAWALVTGDCPLLLMLPFISMLIAGLSRILGF